MKKEEYFCDVKDCGGKDNVMLNGKDVQDIQVIFTTDQTEGRSVKSYLCSVKIDICEDCYNKILKGNYLFAHGAQGNNTYYFKEKKKWRLNQ